jgi:hypothetical protein
LSATRTVPIGPCRRTLRLTRRPRWGRDPKIVSAVLDKLPPCRSLSVGTALDAELIDGLRRIAAYKPESGLSNLKRAGGGEPSVLGSQKTRRSELDFEREAGLARSSTLSPTHEPRGVLPAAFSGC